MVENVGIEGLSVPYIGKLDRKLYSCVTEDIATDDVIITDRQIQHIMQRHPGDYERFSHYIPEILRNPDFILEANKPNTAFVMKRIAVERSNFQLILRLRTSFDPAEYQNSIITFLKIDQRKWGKYLRNKKVLYRSE